MTGWRRFGVFGVAALIAILSVPAVQALEVREGRMRLVLHEGIGRFSLYIRSAPEGAPSGEPAGARFIPLFVDRDPRTSGLNLVVNNKIYKMGDTAEFSERVEKASSGRPARFLWESKTVRVVQEFLPVSSSASAQADGVRMSIRIENLTRGELTAGVRLCLDTYLGEETLSHFSTDRHQEIRGELSISTGNMVRFWQSGPSQSSQDVGLFCLTAGPEVTSPDEVVFANWKRLSESSWGYQTSTKRNFNLMPYSINDSAVCLYYEPETLKARGSREVSIILGDMTLGASGEAPQAAASLTAGATLEALGEQLRTSSRDFEDIPAAILQDLDHLNKLLEAIEDKLSPGADISDEDIRLMEQILSDIKDRSERYSGAQ